MSLNIAVTDTKFVADMQRNVYKQNMAGMDRQVVYRYKYSHLWRVL